MTARRDQGNLEKKGLFGLRYQRDRSSPPSGCGGVSAGRNGGWSVKLSPRLKPQAESANWELWEASPQSPSSSKATAANHLGGTNRGSSIHVPKTGEGVGDQVPEDYGRQVFIDTTTGTLSGCVPCPQTTGPSLVLTGKKPATVCSVPAPCS